ncbi:predicted protein [Histoplasma capsulatum var. duboisii H88]|uniref:Predicted protein n=1 Tax=Ajellomyces capsulatus (strain H88) TaxID=544711 RepID=F0UNZ3_AJEC8|nr:predicted protein [Histoplasma capsulatum var. duboisii H88]
MTGWCIDALRPLLSAEDQRVLVAVLSSSVLDAHAHPAILDELWKLQLFNQRSLTQVLTALSFANAILTPSRIQTAILLPTTKGWISDGIGGLELGLEFDIELQGKGIYYNHSKSRTEVKMEPCSTLNPAIAVEFEPRSTERPNFCCGVCQGMSHLFAFKNYMLLFQGTWLAVLQKTTSTGGRLLSKPASSQYGQLF